MCTTEVDIGNENTTDCRRVQNWSFIGNSSKHFSMFFFNDTKARKSNQQAGATPRSKCPGAKPVTQTARERWVVRKSLSLYLKAQNKLNQTIREVVQWTDIWRRRFYRTNREPSETNNILCFVLKQQNTACTEEQARVLL